jgi:hypothetical protein
MRLKAGVYRELHWHRDAEWAFMIAGTARIYRCRDQTNPGGFASGERFRRAIRADRPSGVPRPAPRCLATTSRGAASRVHAATTTKLGPTAVSSSIRRSPVRRPP